MKIGIIGPPQSGKTTLFKILLAKDPSGNIGIFKVMDSRVEKISERTSSRKKTYPEFTFVDIGPTTSFSKKDLSQLQDIDLFLCVVGSFFNGDPKKDFESCLADIALSDLEVIEGRIARLHKETKGIESEQESKVLEKCQEIISEGKFLCKAGLGKDELKWISGLVLLSLKPLILVINISEKDSDLSKNKAIEEYCRLKDIRYVNFLGKMELEVLAIEAEEREEFLKEMNPGYNFKEEISRLISKELDIITFFTTGEKETRGWHLKNGLSVIEAAGKIHSDMKRGFIRAEVISFDDFVKCGSMGKARELGLLKVEGKDYVVKEGDIINIRFNV